MVSFKEAKRIGYRQAFKAITIGLVIAYFICALFGGALWFFGINYVPTLIFAVIFLYAAGYLFGGMAGKYIIIKEYSAILVGIISGFLMVLSATFLASLFWFF